MALVRAEAELDERARVGSIFVLPAVVCLEALHGLLGFVVPDPGGFSIHVVRTNERGLDLGGAVVVNLLLPSTVAGIPAGFLPRLVSGGGMRSGAGWPMRR